MTSTPHAVSPARQLDKTSGLGWPGVFYAIIALTGCVFAFVGLSSSSFWADELFTMLVTGHHQGLREVFHLVLADVHPPLYDFFLYEWIERFGSSEWVVRLPSAIFAVASVILFGVGARRSLTPTAIAFAGAVATTSMFWYVQSQNARNYALAIVISSALLAVAVTFHRRVHAGGRFPVGTWLGLTLLGILGSQVHAYMLLTVGMVLLFLLVTSRHWTQRIAVVFSGLIVLGLYAGLLWLMTHAAGHNYQDTWFRNSAKFFGSHLRRAVFNFMSQKALLIVVVMLIALRWARPAPTIAAKDEAQALSRWTSGLCGVVCVGVILCGIAVSLLVAPSFSYRNVLVCAPFGWYLVGRLYDLAGPRGHTRLSAIAAAIIVLLLGAQSILLARGRMLPANEPWRASAAFVESLPGCAHTTVPVIALPDTYGAGPSSVMQAMVGGHYYGYYLPPSYRLKVYFPDELLQHIAQSSADSCPVLGWVLHDVSDEAHALALAKRLASQPGVANHQVLIQELLSYDLEALSWKPQPSAFVFLRATPDLLNTPASLANDNAADHKHAIGARLLVTYSPASATYEVQHLHANPGT